MSEEFENLHDVRDRSPETIQADDDHRVDPAAFRVREESVERGAPRLRATLAVVDVLPHIGPPSGGAVTPKLDQLRLGVLVQRAASDVGGDPHRAPPRRPWSTARLGGVWRSPRR